MKTLIASLVLAATAALSTGASAATVHEILARLDVERSRLSWEVSYGQSVPKMPDGVKLRKGDVGPSVELLKNRLGVVSAAGQEQVFDDATDAALRAYQEGQGLVADGIYGRNTAASLNLTPERKMAMIDASLDAMASVPAVGKAVLVDIPGYRLIAFEDGEAVMVSKVIVGRSVRQTPSMVTNMWGVKFNPDWTPPPTIVKKDIVPGLRDGNLEWLVEHGMAAYDREGVEVPLEQVTYEAFAAGDIRFKQPPGEDNALGILKFELDNKENIYLHDTNSRYLFDRTNRAYSSGCVRVQDWRELAKWAMGRDDEYLDKWFEKGDTALIPLKEKIPVVLAYTTAMPEVEVGVAAGAVTYSRDIYGKIDESGIFASNDVIIVRSN